MTVLTGSKNQGLSQETECHWVSTQLCCCSHLNAARQIWFVPGLSLAGGPVTPKKTGGIYMAK